MHRAYVLSDPPAIQTEAVEAVLGRAARGRAAAGGGPADAESWPAVPVRVGETLDAVERKLLLATLQAVNGDRKTAAELLGISLKTVYNRLKEYGLDSPRASRRTSSRLVS